MIYMLGETRVAAIVEGNKALHGSTFHGIPIIPFEEFLVRYSTYPVIVTPRFCEDDIMEQLKRENIIGSFPLSKEVAQMTALLLQLPTDQIVKQYKNNEELAIYGVSLLGLILYDLFFENGFKVSLMIPSNTDTSLEKYMSETLELRTISSDEVLQNNMRLLLSTEMGEPDKIKLQGVACDRYFDLHLRKELFYKPELEKFKNIHKGQRCFIVATGPSLRICDLDTLYNNGEICISVNGIFKAFNQTKWRPNYYMISDTDGGSIWENEILRMDIQAKFVSDIICCFRDKHYDNIYKWHFIHQTNDDNVPSFSDDFACGGYRGYTIVYEGALQLAVYMGFREIYLVGTDCTISPDGKTPHFVADYAEDPGHLFLDEIMLAYQTAKQYADSHGIKIYNATRGGALEIFPRVDFDSLFNEKEKR